MFVAEMGRRVRSLDVACVSECRLGPKRDRRVPTDSMPSDRSVSSSLQVELSPRESITVHSASRSGTSTMVPKAYAQLFRDGEAGVDYAEARMYQFRTGRFTAPDPVPGSLENPQSWNHYVYGLNSPLAFVDPTGLTAEHCDWIEGWVDTGNGEGYLGSQLNCTDQKDPGGSGFGSQAWREFTDWMTSAWGPSIATSGGESADQSSSGGFGWPAPPLLPAGCNNLGCADLSNVEVSMAGVPSPGVMGAAIVAIGARGEQLVRSAFSIGDKAAVMVNSRMRIPDGLSRNVVTEIKNVAYQANTLQLRDLATAALQSGRRLDLWVRTNTVISGPLQQAVGNSNGTIRILPILPPR